MRRNACSVPFALAILLFTTITPGQSIAPKPADLAAQRASSPPRGVQADWWSQVQANIQKEEYEITWQEETALPGGKAAYQAPSRAQGFRTWFTEEGIRVVPRDAEKAKWEWGLALAGLEAESRKLEAGEGQKPGINIPSNQWTDISGDDPGGAYDTWFFQVSACNSCCMAEGPF